MIWGEACSYIRVLHIGSALLISFEMIVFMVCKNKYKNYAPSQSAYATAGFNEDTNEIKNSTLIFLR